MVVLAYLPENQEEPVGARNHTGTGGLPFFAKAKGEQLLSSCDRRQGEKEGHSMAQNLVRVTKVLLMGRKEVVLAVCILGLHEDFIIFHTLGVFYKEDIHLHNIWM